ncbi:hypothetical protein HWB91_gp44 [Bacillus phage vB_BboS-125]|uniref:Phage protein n=1 Tax=Bacillus phage vB_BboS-125 TaxID=2419618 RepID=A0A3G3BVY7_9CAUD|nr:hypothetical protein HWB91_gp44 [Bacillus phage vB_BboS-125]AYP68414.1 hypothetical protein BboS125_00045 [Bacillus phage vB_BboS-125]
MTEANKAIQEEAAKTNEVAVKQEGAVATTAAGSNYISTILEETKRGFVEANAGLDLDYVRMGDWLKLNKKGNYVEKDDEEVSYGDSIDVVVGYGEQRYMLWGKDGSAEKGELIVAEPTEAEAREVLGQWLMENPEAAERYSQDDISLRYLAYVVPVSTLGQDDFPKIYLLSFAPGDTIGWGRYAMNVFKGKFKALGVPAKTGANKVVTRITSEERENSDKESYLGHKFEAVGLFNPADYGIKVEA